MRDATIECRSSIHGALPIALGALLFLHASPARARLDVPPPTDYVVDQAGVMDANTKDELQKSLLELEQKTGAQVIALVVNSTDGEDFFDFVQRHATAWKLGQKKQKNGALVALSIGDRQVRIHPGYGLEGTLPDSWCGSASREVRDEFFREGKYSAGMQRLVMMVATKIADEAGVTLDGAVRPRATQPLTLGAMLVLAIIILVVLVYVYYQMSRMQGRRRWRGSRVGPVFWGGGNGSRFGGGFGSFGGGSSGSFGGFGGGGGGSFGGAGGGASW